MIVLWYGATAAIGVVVASGSTIGICFGLLIGTGVIIFTLSEHPRVRKKRVAFWVLGPISALCLIFGGLLLFESKPSLRLVSVPATSAELFDLHMQLSYACGEITGRVRNHSEKTLKSIKVRVELSDPTGTIDGADTDISVEVPSGETRSFSSSVCGLRESPGWTWSYNVLEVRGQ
jgi:hypothetical protein